VSSGGLAFLVDWILRRDSARAEVRISMWVRRIGRVLRSQSGMWREDGTGFDLELVARPRARFSGTVTVGGKHSGSMMRLAAGPLPVSPSSGRLAVGVCGWRRET
jgi:hypothetical protein